MDRYLCARSTTLHSKELQMLGLTCFLVMSKLVEIVSLSLDDIADVLCKGKYRYEQFVWTETNIFSELGCEIETPHVLEFTTFYFKALRLYIQCSQSQQVTIQTYINYAENIAVRYCRMVMMDLELMSVKPSILGATAIYFSLYNAQHFITEMNENARKKRMKMTFSLADLNLSINSWGVILKNLIQEVEPQNIFDFTNEICERASFIYHSQDMKFQEVYTPVMVEFLPKFDNEWVRRFSNII